MLRALQESPAPGGALCGQHLGRHLGASLGSMGVSAGHPRQGADISLLAFPLTKGVKNKCSHQKCSHTS